MIGTYISAAIVCAASLLVGRAVLAAIGRRGWSWLEPAVGFAALITVSGFFVRAPGHAGPAAVALVLLLVAAAVALVLPYRLEGIARGLPVVVLVGLALAIPFAVSGHFGLVVVGFNNDLGLHLAWSQWLRDGLGTAPDSGYPLGPH